MALMKIFIMMVLMKMLTMIFLSLARKFTNMPKLNREKLLEVETELISNEDLSSLLCIVDSKKLLEVEIELIFNEMPKTKIIIELEIMFFINSCIEMS